jgi:hypothetical protein
MQDDERRRGMEGLELAARLPAGAGQGECRSPIEPTVTGSPCVRFPRRQVRWPHGSDPYRALYQRNAPGLADLHTSVVSPP